MKLATIPDNLYLEAMGLVNKTNKDKPKSEDIKALRRLLGENPGLWCAIGDMAQQAQEGLIQDTSMTPGARELIKAGLVSMRHDLGYSDSSMLEKIIIEQVLLSWLRLNIYEQQLTRLNSKGMTLDMASFWEKRLSASYSRYLRACETLARIRRLAHQNPALQVNVAAPDGQQVNIAGDFVKKG